MAYADMWRHLYEEAPRRLRSDHLFHELAVDHWTSRALEAAGIDRVSALRAQLEEHESLCHIPGIGPKREVDIRAALELYDETQLPLDEPEGRRNALMLLVHRAGWDLLAAARLSDDQEWAESVERFVDEFVAEHDRTTSIDTRQREEAWQIANAALAERKGT